jgi:uncharacterized repeat protein (TIGR01451 family)
MMKKKAHIIRACALITIVAFSFLAPARAAINIDGIGIDWPTGAFQIPDGENDIGAPYNSGYEITRIWVYYEVDKLYFRMDVKGLPGDADGDGDRDTAFPTDQPGVGINEIYRFRIDKNNDGIFDITIEYSNNSLHVVGVDSAKVSFAYDGVIEAGLKDVASLGINPYSFRLYAYAGTSLDGLPEDTVPTTDINLSPVLHIQKSVDKQEASPGDTLTYTISYSNTGFSDAKNVIITDTIPTNTSYVSGGTVSGTNVTWNLGTLAMGETGSVTLKVRVNSPLDNGTIIRNIAAIISDQTVSQTSQADTTIHSAPILAIGKTDSPDPVPVNSSLTYTITYSNTGDMNATNAIIVETYPQLVTFVSSVPPPTEGNNIWRMSALDVGKSGSIVITVSVGALTEGTVLTNKATITSDQTQNTETEIETTVSSVILNLVKTDTPDPVNAGQNLTYTLSYSNTGTLNATNVIITESYDTNTTFVSSVPAPDTGTSNKFTIGSLVAGVSGSITIVVRVSPSVSNGTTITNIATIDSAQTEPLSTTVTTLVTSQPILSIVKDVDKLAARPNETLTYTITVKNNGTANATGVTLTDAIPSRATLVSGSITGGGTGIATITWNLGTLTPSQTKAVGFEVKVESDFTGIITNVASVDSDQTEEQSDDAYTVVSKDMVIAILLSPPSQTKEILKCEKAVFPITVRNKGDTIDTITLTFTQPPSGWSVSLDRTEVTLDPGTSTIVYLSTSACMEAGRITTDVKGTSGNDPHITSSVSTLTLIKNGATPNTNQGSSGNAFTSSARQNLIIVNVKSGTIYFLKNSMVASTIEMTGTTLALQVDVTNRGLRTAHDVTLSFKGFTDFTVQPAKQDIAGGKIVTYTVTLNFLEFPQSLVIFADGREDDSGTYKMKMSPPPPAPEPAVIKPTLAPVMPTTPSPQSSPMPAEQPATPTPTFAPTMTPTPQEIPAPAVQPSIFERLGKKAKDSIGTGLKWVKEIAPYAGAVLAMVSLLVLLYAFRRKIRDILSSIIMMLKRVRMPRIIPQRRPKPTPQKPTRHAHGIPGRKHKFVLETEGF